MSGWRRRRAKSVKYPGSAVGSPPRVPASVTSQRPSSIGTRVPERPGRESVGSASTWVSGKSSAPHGTRKTRLAQTSPESTSSVGMSVTPSPSSQCSTREPRPLASTTRSARSSSSRPSERTRTPVTRSAVPTRDSASARRTTTGVVLRTASRRVQSSRSRLQQVSRRSSVTVGQRRCQPCGPKPSMSVMGCSRAPAASRRRCTFATGSSSWMASRPLGSRTWACRAWGIRLRGDGLSGSSSRSRTITSSMDRKRAAAASMPATLPPMTTARRDMVPPVVIGDRHHFTVVGAGVQG